jgi:putative addiction module component (TIGR02574 family)
MPVSIEALGIDRLSVGERLELIEQIWNSLPESVEPDEVPAWHLAELAQRRADAEANPGVGRPWREVLEELEGGA